MADKGGSDSTKATTTTEPWSGVQSYLKGAYGDAESIYNQGAPGYYPGSTVAPMSGYTTGALDTLFNRGQQGSAVGEAAKGMAMDTMSGSYLNSNPHLSGAIDAATRPMIENYQNNIMPGMDSMFSMAGRYASDPGAAHAQMAQQAGQNLNRQIGDVSSQMSYQNYGDERNRMMQAGLLAPTLAGMDYTDIQAMGQAGQGFDQYNQSLVNADVDKWNYTQNADWNMVNDYLGLLNGNNYNTSTQVQKQPGTSTFGSAVNGALGGAAAGTAIMPGWGTLIGGGLGLLSGLF